jgi:TrmH RNA methyltransferase
MKNTKKNFDKSKEQKIYGINAVKMLFKKSPERVIKLYVDENSLKQFKDEMRLCGQLKKAYHIVKAVDLEKISNSTHHEGVVCIAVKPPCYSLKEFLAKKSDSSLIMALENVSNPHNIGAIARTAAHFGVDAFLVADASNFFSSASYRTAEGGMESIKVIQEKDFLRALKLLSEHKYELIGTSSHSKDDVTQFKFKPHTVIMMGEERNGLSIDASKLCTKVLQIKGTNNVESMNVSLASGIVIYEYRKQFKIN